MATDVNASLPIRTENPGDVSIKLVDKTTTANAAAVDASGNVSVNVNNTPSVKLDDGSGNPITATTQGTQKALDVGVNFGGALIDPRAVRALTIADIVTANIKDASGNAFSVTNPLPVSVGEGGSEVNDYVTAAALAAGSTSNHDYAVTSGKTMRAKLITASGSGKIKIEVQISPDGTTFTSKFVAFNSVSNPNISLPLGPLSLTETGTGSKIRVIVSNLDKSPFDVYSTISGTEI